MLELNEAEIDLVSGGIGPGGAAIGALGGVISAIQNDGNIGTVIAGALLGGVAGFFGSIATSGMGAAISGIFGAKALAVGALTNEVTK